MLLSIIIPYYNSDAWIGAMLDSLLDQDLNKDDYEIIVIDDGSSESPRTLLDYSSVYPNIHYYREDNAGPSQARNYGLRLSKGKWVFFCDSDDYIQRQALGKLIRVAEEKNLELLLFDYLVIKSGESAMSFRRNFTSVSEPRTMMEHLATYKSHPMSYGFGACRYIVQKDVLTKNSISFEDLAYVEDRIFQLRLIPVIQRMAHIDVELYFYIQRDSSILHAKKKRRYTQYAPWLWYYMGELSKLIRLPSIPDEVKHVLNCWRDTGAFSLLINTLKYCPFSVSREYINKVSTSEAYPLEIRGPQYVRLTRKCMNHPTLWIVLCKCFSFVPYRIRLLL